MFSDTTYDYLYMLLLFIVFLLTLLFLAKNGVCDNYLCSLYDAHFYSAISYLLVIGSVIVIILFYSLLSD